jgi:hypothetical protein
MNKIFVSTAKTTALLLWNKGIAIVILALLMARYATLGETTPFAEILYAAILAVTVIVVAPVIRLLVFPEAAEYAESGKLKQDLGALDTTAAIRHYQFATAISYIVTLLCVSGLLS